MQKAKTCKNDRKNTTYNFDKKGRVKTLKKTNMRRDDKYDKY